MEWGQSPGAPLDPPIFFKDENRKWGEGVTRDFNHRRMAIKKGGRRPPLQKNYKKTLVSVVTFVLIFLPRSYRALFIARKEHSRCFVAKNAP